ncbi:MAG: TetR/AcrR family transcriptional regulator C-terminal domain-containing protein [Thermomicrobiales bacterium]
MAKGVTVAAIVDAGFAVLDERGLDGLTMRLVADRLGVKAPAIYWHLASKADLLDEMATAMWREAMAATAGGIGDDAAVGLTAFAHAVRSTMLRYRDGAKLFAGTYLTDTDLLRQQEAGLATMLAQGFDVRGAVQATSLVYNFTVGFTIEEQAVAQSQAGGDERYTLEARDRRVDVERYPLTAEVGVALFTDQDARFAELLKAAVHAAMSFRKAL